MTQRRKASSTTTRRKWTATKKKSTLLTFLRRNPRTAWWLGGIAMIGIYIWLFYSFFVSPTGFRWRALYGDANYPEG